MEPQKKDSAWTEILDISSELCCFSASNDGLLVVAASNESPAVSVHQLSAKSGEYEETATLKLPGTAVAVQL